jgi:hypothetical protein
MDGVVISESVTVEERPADFAATYLWWCRSRSGFCEGSIRTYTTDSELAAHFVIYTANRFIIGQKTTVTDERCMWKTIPTDLGDVSDSTTELLSEDDYDLCIHACIA